MTEPWANDWEQLRCFARSWMEDKLKAARQADPEIQMSRLSLSGDEAIEMLIDSWRFVCRMAPPGHDNDSSCMDVGAHNLDTEAD